MSGMHSTVAQPKPAVAEVEEKATHDDPTQQKMLQTITFKLGSFDDDSRTFKAIGSTPQVDRQGDTIEQDGWVLGNFIKNPVIPWAHNYSELPVARAIEVGVENGNLVFTYQAPPEGMYPFADIVWNMYRNQFMFAFSVGFMPIEYDGNWEDGYNFTKCELLEISAVPVPANAGALVLAQKMGFMSQKDAQSMVSKIEDALKGLKEINNIEAKKELPQKEVKTEGVEEAKKEKTNKDEQSVEVTLSKSDLKEMMAEILKELSEVHQTVEDEEAKEVVRNDLPLADKDEAWDKGAAVKSLKDWATDDNGDIDFSKYEKGFMYCDPANKDKQGGYKLPFAKVIDGEPHAVWNAVKAIYGVLQGARGGVDIPEDEKAGVLAQVKKYYKKFGEGEPGNTDESGKGLTNVDNMVQNGNMTETKSGAKISKDTKDKIKAVMDGLMEVVTTLKSHHEALGELYNVGADSGETSADNDDPKGNGKPETVDGKSIDSKDSKVDKTNEVVADAKAADEESEEGAEQEDKEAADTSKSDEKADEKVETEAKAEDDATEESKEKTEEATTEVEATEEKTEDEAKADDAEEKVETEKSAKSEDEYLIDPENLSDEDIVKLTAAVQAELDKEN